jgi:hypothetical protein
MRAIIFTHIINKTFIYFDDIYWEEKPLLSRSSELTVLWVKPLSADKR